MTRLHGVDVRFGTLLVCSDSAVKEFVLRADHDAKGTILAGGALLGPCHIFLGKKVDVAALEAAVEGLVNSNPKRSRCVEQYDEEN